MPKPPPTSWVRTRIFSGTTLNTDFGQHLAHHGNALRGRDQGVALSVRIEAGDGGARLHGAGCKTGIGEPHALDVGGAREGRVDRGRVAVLPVERDVAGCLGPHLRGVRGHGPHHISHGRQMVVGDVHRLGRIQRLRQRLRDHDRDRLADIAHALGREHGHPGGEHRLAVAPREDGDRRNGADAVGHKLAPGDHADDAGHAACRSRVHRPDVRMRDRSTHERGVGLPGDRRHRR